MTLVECKCRITSSSVILTFLIGHLVWDKKWSILDTSISVFVCMCVYFPEGAHPEEPDIDIESANCVAECGLEHHRPTHSNEGNICFGTLVPLCSILGEHGEFLCCLFSLSTCPFPFNVPPPAPAPFPSMSLPSPPAPFPSLPSPLYQFVIR